MKVGDIVKCINGTSEVKGPKTGKYYTVERINQMTLGGADNASIKCVELEWFWYKSRFIVDKESKVRKLLKQIDAHNPGE